MGNSLQDKIAVITGGSSGIGLATAKRFVAEGAFVFITGRRQAELDKAVAEIGDNVAAIQADSSSLPDLDRVYETVRAQQGRVDIVLANAGILEHAPLGQITEEHFDRLFSINVKGLVFAVQKALPLMPDGGAIILMSSTVAGKGLDPQLRSRLDRRSQGSQDTGQRHQPGADRNGWARERRAG